jgi:integrase/recombinase XerD
MRMSHVAHSLAMRRAAGLALAPIAGDLRSLARFATQRGETPVVATTAMAWAKLAQAAVQRHYRLQTVLRFARFMAAEDPRHQMPPPGILRGHRQRPIPDIFSETESAPLLLAARQRGPSGS